MPLAVEDVMRLLCTLSRDKKMKAAVKHWKRGTFVAVTVAMISGIVAGPKGLLVGVVAGELLGNWINRGHYKPVPEILKMLPPSEQKKLFNKVKAIHRNLEFMTIGQLTMLVMGSEALQQRLLALLEDYLTKELHLNVQYGD